MMNGSNYSLSDIAAATGSNNRANDMWGGDGFSLIWLVLIFAIFGWGGFGGWGGGFGGNGGNGANGAGFQGWATRADINEGFALNDIQNGIRGIQQGICDSTYALNNTMQSGFNGMNVGMLQGFNGVQQAINADTVAGMQNTNALQSQLANCCCETREAIQGINYNLATNTFEIGSIVSGELKNVKNTVIDYGLVITLGDKNQTNYNKGAIQIAASIEDSFIRCNFGGWGEWINLKVDTSNFVKITDTYNPNISMFENIGVIGDSYSSGGMVINGEIVVKYGLSFPQVLKRQTGVDFVNYSFAGATCKTWLTNTSYGLSKLKSETKKQLYCICLGINDADGQETQPTGTIDDIKENYNENPNTFFGNMGKIISELQEYSPKSKILIFGIPKKQSQYVDYSVHIKQIANKFNLPYVDSMSNSFISSDDFQNNMSGGHPLAVGYSKMAVAIKELIEKALLNSYFSDYTGDV